MDFFQSQDVAKRRTTWLVALFVLAVIAIIAVTYMVISLILVIALQQAYFADPQELEQVTFWNPHLLVWVGLGTLLVVGFASAHKISALAGGGHVVAEMLGGRLVEMNTATGDERKLLNVVEEMAIASGIPVPPIYILDDSAINAFAAGYQLDDAVIGVTRGAIENLDRAELQGVIAHEFSHIFNGDMRLNIRLIGIVHGIMALGLIGYFVLRSAVYSSAASRRSSRDSNPLPLLAIGGALVVIGGLGTFFGNLIKSAVSRQREFLADASAVQFTRYPAGIAGALKKIGGLQEGSRLQNPSVNEVSHMLFGSGVRHWFGLLATHPPLKERIRRIDPSFDGKFPVVQAPRRTRTEADQQRSGAAMAGLAGLAGKDTLGGSVGTLPPLPPLAVDPSLTGAQRLDQIVAARRAQLQTIREREDALRRIGNPSSDHVEHARQLIAAIPQPVRDAAHEPFGARAVIFCLVIDRDPASRRRQLERLQSHADEAVYRHTRNLLPRMESMDAALRLPLVDMAIPALRGMSASQYQTFIANLNALVEADDKLDLFEWTLHRIIKHHLAPSFEKVRSTPVHYYHLKPLKAELSVLLSTLAYAGHTTSKDSRHAFDLAAHVLGAPGVRMLDKDQCSLNALDDALSKLDALSPREKRKVIQACAVCISADHEITPREAELFRAIGDSLSCPIPPLLPSKPLLA